MGSSVRYTRPILCELVNYYSYKTDKPDTVEAYEASELLRFVTYIDLKYDGHSEAEISKILSQKVHENAKDLKLLTRNKGHNQLKYTKERYEQHDEPD